MGKEAYASDEYQTKGYSPVICVQTKPRAEAIAINSAVRRAFAAIDDREQLPACNQITKVIIMNSSSRLSKVFNDTVYEYLMNNIPALEQIPGVSDENYRFCRFYVQKIEKRGISLQF